MEVSVAASALDAMLAHAASDSPREACGLLLGSRSHIAHAQPAANVAADPARAFVIDPATLFAALRAERAGGPVVTGWYHSHPGGRPTPSAADAAGAREDGKLWAIVADGVARLFRAEAGGFAPVAVRVGAR